MSELHIVCGFDMPAFEDAIKPQLKALGYDAVIHTQISKKGVKDYIDKNENCNTVILIEIADKKNRYTAEEVAALTDKRDVNVIIVLNARHIGSEYVKTLYSAGITNAIFQKGRKDGASAREIAGLIVNKRSRAEARKYYGIESQKIELGFIDDETYVGFYKKLHKDENILKNYLEVCVDLSPKQIGDFTRRLSVSEKEYLAQFEEFHMLMEALKEFGIDLKIKRPKKTSIGLKVPGQVLIRGESICFEKSETNDAKEQASERTDLNEANPVDKGTGPTQEETDPYEGMSIAELLMAVGGSGSKAVQNDTPKVDSPLEVEDIDEEVHSNTTKAVENVKSQEDNFADNEAVRKAMEEVERKEKLMEQDAIEKQRVLDAERDKLNQERRQLEMEKLAQEKEIEKKQKQVEKEKAEALRQIEKERKAQQKQQREEEARRRREEIERRKHEEAERRRQRAIAAQEDDDDFELTYDGRQFSGGFLVALFALCVLAVAALFGIPYLSQMGLL